MAVDMLDGKDAETSFKVIERFADSTLVECALKTGRTHQIRVHMNYINHPVIGDPIYGKGNKVIYNDRLTFLSDNFNYYGNQKVNNIV